MSARDREHMNLRAAGWEQTDRGGVGILQTPDKCFYYSQEVAVEMDRGRAKPYVPKCRGGGT